MPPAASFPLGAAVTLEALEGDAHPVLARLREREPVSWLPALGGWLVTRRDLAMAVMRDDTRFTVDDPRFTTGRVVGPSMLSTDGAEHARHRAPFARPFRLAEVRERFTRVAAEETDALLGALAPAGAGDLRTAFAAPLATVVVTHALGLQAAGTATVLGWYARIVDAVTQLTGGRPLPPAGPEAVAELGAAVRAAMDADPGGSLVAAAAGHAGGLSRDEVVSNAAVLLFGGIETTEGMIATALVHLLREPGALTRVRADPRLAAAALEESLRLEPAAATVDRYATADTELAGARIAAGDYVVVSIAAANRDPAVFADPDAFDLDRADARRHVAFAHGPHVCVGMHLARLEAHTALERALARLPGLRLTDPAGAESRGLVFRKPPAVAAAWDA